MRGISNAGLNEVNATFRTTLTQNDVGKAVAFTDNDTVGLGVDGDEIAGKLIRVEKDGVCLVQVTGYMTLSHSAAPTLGGKIIVDGAGKIKPAPGVDPNAAAIQTVKGRGLVTSIDAASLTTGLVL